MWVLAFFFKLLLFFSPKIVITSLHNFVTGKKGNVIHRQSQELEFIMSPSNAPAAYNKHDKYNKQLFLIQLQ